MSVSRTLGILATLVLVLGVWLFATSSISQGSGTLVGQESGWADPIQLIRSNVDGIAFSVNIPAFEWSEETVGGIAYDVVTVAGFESSSASGGPQVPSRRILLGIPLGADYEVRVWVEESEMLAGQRRLLPAPTTILAMAPGSSLAVEVPAPEAVGWDYAEDEQIYSTNALYPQELARVAGTGFIRDQRYVAVQVNPVQFNPVSGEVVLYERFTVEVELANGHSQGLTGDESGASFEPLLSASLLNYESAAGWRGKQASTLLPASSGIEAIDAGLPALKILVNEDGIYQVAAADLQAVGVPVGEVPTTTYKLYYRGREVPIRVLETAEGVFQALWFFGEKAQTKYSDTNVYWLSHDPDPPPSAEPGLRMPTRSVLPDPVPPPEISTFYTATVRLEEDHWYRSYMPWVGEPGMGLVDPWDHWFWNYTYYPLTDPAHPPSMSFPVQLSGLSTAEPYTATLHAAFSGWSSSDANPDHCVEFYVNGKPAGAEYRYTWDGKNSAELVTLAFPSSHLREGANTVDVSACATAAPYDITFYDWFELDVRRNYLAEDDSLTFDVAEAGWQYLLGGFSTSSVEIFDVSGTYTVSRLVDAEVTGTAPTYSVAFYDGTAMQGTRYLALAHGQFRQPVAIVEDEPSDLTDTANHADYIVIAPEIFIPYIQPLVEHRVSRGLAVEVVDLVSIFDEFNYGIYSPEAIRDFLDYAFHSWSGASPSYVLLVGDGTYDYKGNLAGGNPNLLPPYLAWVDPWIGETAADNQYVAVSGDDPFPDMYIGRLPVETTAQLSAMVAKIIAYETNPAPGDWVERALFVTDNPDSAGPFYSYSDDLVNNYLPEPYVPIKAYYGSTCLTGAACKQVILDTLNSTGALLVNYIGHAGTQLWTNNGVWGINDLGSLAATSRLPVMLPMTCWEGAFHQAQVDVLAEATVRLDGKGAVASWSATGEGVADGHDYLDKGFLQAALYDGVRELGAAAATGKIWVSASGYYTDLLETYHLFGDPALRLNTLADVAVGQWIEAPEVPEPGNLVDITLTFTNSGPGVESGVVLTNLLPVVLVNPSVEYAGSASLTLHEGTMFVWTIDNLQPGASGQIIIHATVDPAWPEPEVSFFSRAVIAAQVYDQVPQNNVALVGVNTKKVYLPVIMKRH